MPNRIKIVVIAALFNMLFEFSIRGFEGILHRPGYPIILFFIYVSYFIIIEHLIRKYRVTNGQLLAASFAFGLLPMTFLTGVIFAPPFTLGVNMSRLLGINIVWWWALQTILTFYFANRIIKRDWSAKGFGRLGLILSTLYLLAIHIGNFVNSPVLPRGPKIGYLVVLIMFVIAVGYVRRKIRKGPQQAPYEFFRSKILDVLSFGTIAVFVFLGLFIAPNDQLVTGAQLSMRATIIAAVWTGIVFAGLMVYYLKHRRQVTV